MEDVNPEVKSFAQIMDTLGKKQMAMGDLVAIVGKRAAGSINLIAQGFADGSTKFHELTEAMYAGAGTTADTYDAMINTVQGRFEILKSAFQEFQLVLFDTFKAPLKALIGEQDNEGITGVITAMAKAVTMAGGNFWGWVCRQDHGTDSLHQ